MHVVFVKIILFGSDIFKKSHQRLIVFIFIMSLIPFILQRNLFNILAPLVIVWTGIFLKNVYGVLPGAIKVYIYTIFLVSVCIMYRWLDRFRFRFKRFIQGNDTHWQVTPCLQLCAVHVCRSKAIESTAPRVELNSIRLRTLVVSIVAVSGYLILILADNLYFLKTWFNFELPEISCSSINSLRPGDAYMRR